jgi:hypothetical protein
VPEYTPQFDAIEPAPASNVIPLIGEHKVACAV